MAKKRRAGPEAVKKKGRGGRTRGTWAQLTPESLRAWREKHKLSRGRVATMLGVSSTSVQNWETGHAVATRKMQQRLAELVQGKPVAPESRPVAAGGAPGAASGGGDAARIQATAAIVVEAIRSNARKGVSADDVALLIRTVRDALS